MAGEEVLLQTLDSTGTPVTGSSSNPLPVALGNEQLDAFGLIRVSEPGNRLDAEFIYGLQPDLFDAFNTNGAVAHNSTARQAELSLSTANAGDHATLSSHPVPYTPGCSQLVEATGVLDLANVGGGTVEVFLRSKVTGSVTEQTVTQSSWDYLTDDRDWKDSHIFVIDFQSLKTGTIRFGMNTQGKNICVTSIHNDNLRNSGYWQQPTLPLQYRLYVEDKGEGDGLRTYAEISYGDENNAVGFRYVFASATASATMAAICCTVKSEGGRDLQDLTGFPRSVSTAATTRSVASSTVLFPIISIRQKELFNSLPNLSLAFPDHFSVLTNQDIRVVLILGGALTNASWTPVNTTRSTMEYDISASAISGGVELRTDFFVGGATGNRSEAAQIGVVGKSPLWYRLGGETGIITLAAVHLGSAATVRADLGWDEIR